MRDFTRDSLIEKLQEFLLDEYNDDEGSTAHRFLRRTKGDSDK